MRLEGFTEQEKKDRQREQSREHGRTKTLNKVYIRIDNEKANPEHHSDTPTLFLKHHMEDKKIATYIKPKELYELYVIFMKDNVYKKSTMSKNTFMANMFQRDYVTKVEKRIEGKEKTTYVVIDIVKMKEQFKKKFN